MTSGANHLIQGSFRIVSLHHTIEYNTKGDTIIPEKELQKGLVSVTLIGGLLTVDC